MIIRRRVVGFYQKNCFFLVIFIAILENCSASSAPANLDVVGAVLNDKLPIRNSDHPKVPTNVAPQNSVNIDTKPSISKGQLIRQELAMEAAEDCLSKLLCEAGPDKPSPPELKESSSNDPNIVQDLGYLVSRYFSIFADDGKDDSKEVTEDVPKVNKLDGNVKPKTGNKFRSRGSETEILSKDFDLSHISLEDLVADVPFTQGDYNSLMRIRRQRRSRELPADLKASNHMKREVQKLRLARTVSKKLRIGRKIASGMTDPKQCSRFQSTVSEVLSTCPLTTELVKYFNTNIKKGSHVAIVKNSKTALPKLPVIVDEDIVVDDGPEPHFSHVRIPSKSSHRIPLRNPVRYPVSQNTFPKIKYVDQVTSSRKPTHDDKQKVEDDDYENDDEDESAENEYEDDATDEADWDNDETTKSNDNSKVKQNSQPKIVKPPPPKILPPGMIKVYGVPQPSFDKTFSHTAHLIGSGPLVKFETDSDGTDKATLGSTARPSVLKSHKTVKIDPIGHTLKSTTSQINNTKTNQPTNKNISSGAVAPKSPDISRAQTTTTSKPVGDISDEDKVENDEDDGEDEGETDIGGGGRLIVSVSPQEYYTVKLRPRRRPLPWYRKPMFRYVRTG